VRPQHKNRRRPSILRNQNKAVPADDVCSILEAWISELPHSPKYDYLKGIVFSKYVDANTDPAPVRKNRAIEKWLGQELVNAETNERLVTTEPGYFILPGVRWDVFSEWVRAYIARIIGDTIPLKALKGDFSGGATTSRRRAAGHPARKFVGKAHITECAVPWFDLFLTDVSIWSIEKGQLVLGNSPEETSSASSLRMVHGSSMFTVPKNSLIDRVCCKEPDINMFLQKGTGDYFRRRLRKFGINLNDQSRNKSLAQLGSLTGSLATLDLSSASDSICYELVCHFLPIQWSSYLDDIRSKSVLVDGVGEHLCEMFSSMGNGFTFELESLLFFAFAKATAYFTGTKGVISVYGDDIIVPTKVAVPLIEVLGYLGFKTNVEKSFWEGPFRESCGGHYHSGTDITPFFLRSPVKTIVDLIHLLNQIRLWASRGESLFLDENAWVIWDLLSELIPRSLWGGDLLSAGKSQLISPHYPKYRLMPVSEQKSLPVEGRYLSSMLALDDRKGPPPIGLVQEEEEEIVFPFYRRKPAKRWTWHDSGMYFLAEVPDSDTSD